MKKTSLHSELIKLFPIEFLQMDVVLFFIWAVPPYHTILCASIPMLYTEV